MHSETICALHVSKKYEELEPRGNVSHHHMVWSPLQGFPQAWYQGCCPIVSRGSCIIGHEGFDFWQKFVKGVKWTLYLSSSLLLIIAFLFFFMVFLFVVVVFVHVFIHSALFIEPYYFLSPILGTRDTKVNKTVSSPAWACILFPPHPPPPMLTLGRACVPLSVIMQCSAFCTILPALPCLLETLTDGRKAVRASQQRYPWDTIQ